MHKSKRRPSTLCTTQASYESQAASNRQRERERETFQHSRENKENFFVLAIQLRLLLRTESRFYCLLAQGERERESMESNFSAPMGEHN